ncbi:MAG: 50S ribosomal protein L9 [Candidatus Comchoanobacterales bacterium]
MQVILKQTMKNLGVVGSVVSVKPGYARNYLVPNQLAEVATESNMKRLEAQLSALREEEEKRIKLANAVKEKVADFCSNIVIEMNVTEDGQLYGSVGTGDVLMMIKDQLGKTKDFELNKQMVQVNNGSPIKSEGTFEGVLQLHSGVSCPIILKVEAVAS